MMETINRPLFYQSDFPAYFTPHENSFFTNAFLNNNADTTHSILNDIPANYINIKTRAEREKDIRRRLPITAFRRFFHSTWEEYHKRLLYINVNDMSSLKRVRIVWVSFCFLFLHAVCCFVASFCFLFCMLSKLKFSIT